MKAARAAYEQGNAQAALAALEKAERAEGNTRLSLVQIYRLRGQAAVMANKEGVAIDAFKRYLALEPAAKGAGLAEGQQIRFRRGSGILEQSGAPQARPPATRHRRSQKESQACRSASPRTLSP